MSKLNKIQISEFRVGDHNLHIETSRHCKPKAPIEKRTCCKCGSVADEIHFFVDCLLYDEPRVKYKLIETHSNNDSTTTFVEVFINDGKTHMIAKFLIEAFETRNKICKSTT